MYRQIYIYIDTHMPGDYLLSLLCVDQVLHKEF